MVSGGCASNHGSSVVVVVVFSPTDHHANGAEGPDQNRSVRFGLETIMARLFFPDAIYSYVYYELIYRIRRYLVGMELIFYRVVHQAAMRRGRGW